LEAHQEQFDNSDLSEGHKGQGRSLQITKVHQHQQELDGFQGHHLLQQDRQQLKAHVISNMPSVYP
jgi:hypothetical protein